MASKLYDNLFDAMTKALASYAGRDMQQFHMNRAARLTNMYLSDEDRLVLLEQFKREAVELSQKSGRIMHLTAVSHGVSSALYANDWTNHQIHKRAAEVWMDYYKKVVNSRVA